MAPAGPELLQLKNRPVQPPASILSTSPAPLGYQPDAYHNTKQLPLSLILLITSFVSASILWNTGICETNGNSSTMLATSRASHDRRDSYVRLSYHTLFPRLQAYRTQTTSTFHDSTKTSVSILTPKSDTSMADLRDSVLAVHSQWRWTG